MTSSKYLKDKARWLAEYYGNMRNKKVAQLPMPNSLTNSTMWPDPALGAAANQVYPGGIYQGGIATTAVVNTDYTGMIRSRMRWSYGTGGFAFLHAERSNETEVAIFLIANGQAVVLTDEEKLFPSDALITQLRVLENK